MKKIVDVQNVSFAYKNHQALIDINFELYEGQRCALLGPKGGGKTTLVKLLLGILSGYQGNLALFGDHPGRHPALIGYVPQQYKLNPILPVTVKDVVLMGANAAQLKDKKLLSALLTQALQQMHIEHIENTLFKDLSGGQRQRVLVARALIAQPKLLILDEPTSNVDPSMTAQFFALLSALPKDVAVLVVSHDMSILEYQIDVILGLNQTMKVQQSKALTSDMLQHLYGVNSHFIKDLVQSTTSNNEPSPALV